MDKHVPSEHPCSLVLLSPLTPTETNTLLAYATAVVPVLTHPLLSTLSSPTPAPLLGALCKRHGAAWAHVHCAFRAHLSTFYLLTS
eukprot:1159010-Pelagomonas_calceolata.AAC.3